MAASLLQIAGLALVVVGAGIAAGLAGWFIGGGLTLVYFGLAADRQGR